MKGLGQVGELSFARRPALFSQGHGYDVDGTETGFKIVFQVLADMRTRKGMMCCLLFVAARFNCELGKQRCRKNDDKSQPGDDQRRSGKARTETG